MSRPPSWRRFRHCVCQTSKGSIRVWSEREGTQGQWTWVAWCETFRKMIEFDALASTECLDIRSRWDYTELYLDFRPLALTWTVSEGTPMDRLIQFSHPKGESLLSVFRTTLAIYQSPRFVASSLSPFLAPGRYRVVETHSFSVRACLPLAPTSVEATVGARGSYCDSPYLITTVPDTTLDGPTVEHYLRRIQAGEQPRAIALCCFSERFQDYTSAFVLDGHHKLAAYALGRVAPAVVLVARLDSPAPRQPFPPVFASLRDIDETEEAIPRPRREKIGFIGGPDGIVRV